MKRIFILYFLIFHNRLTTRSFYSTQSHSSMSSIESALDFAYATKNAKLLKKNNGEVDSKEDSKKDSKEEISPSKNNSSNWKIPIIALMIGFIIFYDVYVKNDNNSNIPITI